MLGTMIHPGSEPKQSPQPDATSLLRPLSPCCSPPSANDLPTAMTDARIPAPPSWPDVPACHGWLSLDARGHWRLKGERIEHGGLRTFLNANYTCDGAGNWLVNNGPQRVYVELEAAPWILRLMPEAVLQTHTGRNAVASGPVLIDESGHVWLMTDLGPAAIDDRDLTAFCAELKDDCGQIADDAALLALLEGRTDLRLEWRRMPVVRAANAAVPGLLGFQPRPAATA